MKFTAFYTSAETSRAQTVDRMLYGLRGHFDVADEELAAMFQSQQKPAWIRLEPAAESRYTIVARY